MGNAAINRDPRIDAYIARSTEFARPILAHLREIVHEGCPGVVENVKWGMPSFEYKGLLCGMAAFKQHCTFGFWKHTLVVGEAERPAARGGRSKATAREAAKAKEKKRQPAAKTARSDEAMGDFGRITKVSELPSRRQILQWVRKAAALNDAGVKVERPRRAPARPLPVPADLAAGLKKNKAAAAHFEAFSPSKRKDYIEWITEAKTAETRNRRLAAALEWIAEGKSRNWRYERC